MRNDENNGQKWIKVEYELAGREDRVTVLADGRYDARRKVARLLPAEASIFRATEIEV